MKHAAILTLLLCASCKSADKKLARIETKAQIETIAEAKIEEVAERTVMRLLKLALPWVIAAIAGTGGAGAVLARWNGKGKEKGDA